MLLIRKLHKWLGLIVGLQLLLWSISGTMFAWLDHHEVTAEHSTKAPEPATLSPTAQLTEPGAWLSEYQGRDVREIRLGSLLDTPVWRIQFADGAQLRNAQDGKPLAIDEHVVRRLASSHYVGEGRLTSVEFHPTPGMETRKAAGPVWKAQFDDSAATTLYFAADDGQLVIARNSTWRLFDFFWMLHTMDYSGRDNFNNPLVITVGTAALWLSISGLLLLFSSFRRRDFDVTRLWR